MEHKRYYKADLKKDLVKLYNQLESAAEENGAYLVNVTQPSSSCISTVSTYFITSKYIEKMQEFISDYINTVNTCTGKFSCRLAIIETYLQIIIWCKEGMGIR